MWPQVNLLPLRPHFPRLQLLYPDKNHRNIIVASFRLRHLAHSHAGPEQRSPARHHFFSFSKRREPQSPSLQRRKRSSGRQRISWVQKDSICASTETFPRCLVRWFLQERYNSHPPSEPRIPATLCIPYDHESAGSDFPPGTDKSGCLPG